MMRLPFAAAISKGGFGSVFVNSRHDTGKSGAISCQLIKKPTGNFARVLDVAEAGLSGKYISIQPGEQMLTGTPRLCHLRQMQMQINQAGQDQPIAIINNIRLVQI